jgi:hypothetical protein
MMISMMRPNSIAYLTPILVLGAVVALCILLAITYDHAQASLAEQRFVTLRRDVEDHIKIGDTYESVAAYLNRSWGGFSYSASDMTMRTITREERSGLFYLESVQVVISLDKDGRVVGLDVRRIITGP